jgi:hypothetical protein
MTKTYIEEYDKQRAKWEKEYPEFEQLVNPKPYSREEIEEKKTKLREEKWGN